MPWLSKNSAIKLAGKLHICSGSADQTAEAWGTIRRSMKWREKPRSSSQWPSEGAVPFIPISARASRLKRLQSRSIPRNDGLSRCAGRANSPRGVPEYSKRPPSETEKLMWAGWGRPARSAALRSWGSCGR